MTAGGVSRDVVVNVSGVVDQPDIQFLSHISPVLSKLGCNQGACHASQHGKGGFVLSVFGFDPDKDRDMLTRDRDQRRIDLIEPESSLFLQKPTMQIAHGGGKRLTKDSVDYEVLVSWIKRGAPGPRKDSPKVNKLTVWPNQRLGSVGMQQQLRVEATYSTGEVRDVTALARFDTMDDGVVEVTSSGLAKAVGQGQAPLMVRYEGQAALAVFVVPFGPPAQLAGWSNHSFVDELAAQKFRELGIEPSPLCDDATFIRRVFLDCIGTLPTVEETLAFLQSQEPNKRDKLVDRLLGLTGDPNLDIYNEHYAAYWTLKWSDLIRNSSDNLGEQGMWAMHNWIRDSFRQNKPFDKFVRELVMGKGSIYSNGPANYFRINKNSSELAEATSQIFLGIRMECAKCHHHPFEKYSQEDYYALAAFFSRVNVKRSEEYGLFGSEQVVFVKSDGEVRHPRTGKVMAPTTLDGESADDPLDRRLPLANWLTSPKNEFFAKSVVNRYVSYLLGGGLVEPVDDLRSTNPPSNVPLMDALAEEFTRQGFNLKLLMKRILTSRLYQLDSQPTANNAARLQLVGFSLPSDPAAVFKVDAEIPCGPIALSVPMGANASNPAPVVVSDLPVYLEGATDNDSLTSTRQETALPVMISGRVDAESDVDVFAFAAIKGESFSFEVLARRQQSALDSHLRILDEKGSQLAVSDDMQIGKRSSSDSNINSWTAPANGRYFVEIRDLHGRGGPAFVYAIRATRALPGFRLWLDTDKTQLTPGTSALTYVRAERENGFTGEIQLHVEGVPHGLSMACGRILPKGQDGCIVFHADHDAPYAASNLTIRGTAIHEMPDGQKLSLEAIALPYQEIYQPGGGRGHWPVDMHTLCIGDRADLWSVQLSEYDITLKPGESKKIDVMIDRAPGFDKNVTLDVTCNHLERIHADSLPPGVKIDRGRSQTLLTGSKTNGFITLTAAKDAAPADRQLSAVLANVSINFVTKATYASAPLYVTVLAP